MATPAIANKKYRPNEDVTVLKDKTRKKIFGGSVRKLKLEEKHKYDDGTPHSTKKFNVKIKNKRSGTVKAKTRVREEGYGSSINSPYKQYYKMKQLATKKDSDAGVRYKKVVKPLAGNLSKKNIKKALKGQYSRGKDGFKQLKGRPHFFADKRFANPKGVMEKGKPNEILNNPNSLLRLGDCTANKSTGRCQTSAESKRERILEENAPKKGRKGKI